jgi:hypothetical protein
MKWIVTNSAGEPLKFWHHKRAGHNIGSVAGPCDLDECSRFDSPEAAKREAEHMGNLVNYSVIPLVPLDQQ